MKSVYTFLKEYKQLRESETSERAAELGYEWQRRNVYVDPKSGKKYRGTGTKFEEIPNEQPAEKKPGQQAPQKTLDKFKQDAQERPAVAPQTPQPSAFPANPVDDGQEAEMRAVAASQGLWPHYTNARKEYHINRELQQIQADREAAQAELEAQQQPEPQPEPQVEEPPRKEPEEFRTIDDVINQQKQSEKRIDLGSEVKTSKDIKIDKQIDQVNDIMNKKDPSAEDIEEVIDTMEGLRKLITDSVKAEKTEKQYAKFMDKVYKPVEDLISKMDEQKRNSYIALVANARKYTFRENKGVGLNSLGRFDVEQLALAKDRMLNNYDFEDKDSVEKFVRSVRNNEVDDEFVDATFELLPKDLKTSWGKKGMAAKGELGKNHFMGYDKDGNEMRGQGGVSRAKMIWKMYLEQGGRDAYTGLPLKIDNIDLEHIRPASGAKGDLEEFKTREHEKNQVLVNSNVNQSKSELSMKEFFEKKVDPLVEKGDAYWDTRSTVFDYRNSIPKTESEMMSLFLDGKNIVEDMTPDLFMEMMLNHESGLKKTKKELGASAKETGDKEIIETWSKIETQSSLAKELIMGLGLPRGYDKGKNIEGSKPRSNSLGSDNYYRGVFLSMVGKPPEEQERVKKIYRDAIRYAENSGGGDRAFASYMVENGGIDVKAVSKYPSISKIFKSLQEALSDYGRSFISKYNKNNKFF